MQIVKKMLRYFGAAFFGIVALIALLSAALILSQWDGVLEVVVGA